MIIMNIKELDKKYYMNTFGERTDVCFDRGEGIYLYDEDGNKYIDLLGGIAVNALGHCHPLYKEALHNQVDKLIHTSSLYYVKNQALLAKKLCEISCADKVFFANSGAEANEGAIKLARINSYKKGFTNKIEIVTLKNSFHGRTLATVAATGQEKYQKPYKPMLEKFVHVTPNDLSELESAVGENTCAVMLELIQGESGVHPLTKEYVELARNLCDKHGIALIFDEVQTGIGRTGKMFAYENYGVTPDIFTLAKALGGGVPIGAVCAKDEFCAFAPGDHGSTFGGNPFCCGAALAVLNIIQSEELDINSKMMGKYFKEKILAMNSDKIKEVRGMGLMLGIELNVSAKAVNKKLFENKILCGTVGDSTLRFLPPLIINKDNINDFTDVLEKILKELD